MALLIENTYNFLRRGDCHARHLASMMRAGVDGNTNVCGTCKSGSGLLNTIPDAAPPPDNSFIVISGNNYVAAGRQIVVFNNLLEIIKNCRTSKVLITLIFPTPKQPRMLLFDHSLTPLRAQDTNSMAIY
ncbi:hypothetical protein J6590_067006 [Homalodisca vitripennis]|nr:hypothetical protein J6590_067006 [Homalodisca vitripennis]